MNNQRRNAIWPALILMGIGFLALFGEGNALAVLMILFGLLFLVRQFDNNNVTVSWSGREDEGYEEDYLDEEAVRQERQRQTQTTNTEPIYRHALEAVSRAGLDPDALQVLPVDIGVLAFRDSEEPMIYRTWALPDDIDYIQPFIRLRLPTQATGRVRFEIRDSAGKPIFVHEDNHKLARGRTLITPAARLPIHDQRAMDGKWKLFVSTDGVTLATHEFRFAEAHSAEIRRHIGEDGEITAEMRAALTESRLPRMSLDDLLAFQSEEESQQQGKS